MNFDFSLMPGKKIEESNKFKSNYNPTISIITPFYSGHKYIEQVSNCVLNQTYPYFEWLIISDGKNDEDTKRILGKIESLDNRIKVFYKENSGPANTRDYGTKMASSCTKYFLFLDDDDLIDKTFLECAYFSLETNKNASFAYSDTVNFGKTEVLWSRWFNVKEEKKSNMLVDTALIRKEDFFEIGGFGLNEKAINEDYIFWLKLLSKNKIPLRMSYYGFWYRRKDTGEYVSSKEKNNIKRTKELIKKNVDVSNINNNLCAIQYPKYDYEWNDVVNASIDDMVLPYYYDNSKTTILMIIPWIVMGGADKFNIDLISGIDKNKYEVIVVMTNPSVNTWRQKIECIAKEVYDLTSFLDIKYWHLFIKYLISSRNVNIIFNTNSQYGYSMLPYIKNIYPNIPIIDYIHMEEWYNRAGGYSRDSAMVSCAIDKTLTCNQKSADILVDYFGRKKSEVSTIYIGVDENKFDINNYDVDMLKNKYNVSNCNFVINFICRIANQKRPYLFVEIMRELKKQMSDFVCLVAGSGPMLDEIVKLTKKYRLDDNVRFLGNIDNPSEIYAISDVSLNCSIKEGLALTAYESLSMGIPVVSSDVGGQKELITPDTGVIVPCMQDEKDIDNYHYDINEITPYVEGLIKIRNNRDYYRDNCRKRILSGFTISHMLKNMEEIFDDAISNDVKKVYNDNMLYLELMNLNYLATKDTYSYLCEESNCIRFNSKNYRNGWTTSKIKLKIINAIKKMKIEQEAKSLRMIGSGFATLFKTIFSKIINIFRKK